MPVRRESCPKCGYDLTGQFASWTESCPLRTRCSECGFEFYTTDLLGDNRPTIDPTLKRIDGCLALVIGFGFGIVVLIVIVCVVWVALFHGVP